MKMGHKVNLSKLGEVATMLPQTKYVMKTLRIYTYIFIYTYICIYISVFTFMTQMVWI